MIVNERVMVMPDDAISRLPDRDKIHTVRNSASGVLLEADWDRQRVIDLIRQVGVCEESGPRASGSGHGLCLHDGAGWLFIETRSEGREEAPHA